MARVRPRLPAGGPLGAPTFIAYLRVSTASQGRSGLGLEAQQAAVQGFVAQQGGVILQEFTEVESGKVNSRPQLAAALAACRLRRSTLVIAKLDRLARNAAFLLSIVEGSGEGGIAFADLPQIPPGPTGKFLVTLLAAVAELEAGLISQRTRAALAAAKVRGVKLGNPRLRAGDHSSTAAARAAYQEQARAYAEDLRPYVEAAQGAGARSLNQLGAALKARGVRAPNGGEDWHSGQVFRLLRVLEEQARPATPARVTEPLTIERRSRPNG